MTEADVAALIEGIAPVVREHIDRAVTQLVGRMTAAERQLEDYAIGQLRERLAVVETKLPVPGPPGPAGKDGTDGKDGVGFDDLGVVQKDERSFTVTAAHGDVVKEIGTASFPVEIYRGVWADGKIYQSGDSVTCAGSEWHCHVETTTKPGDGSKAWTLKVKRGRDGRDGKDGGVGPAGPPGRDWQQVYDDTRRR